MTPQTVLVSRGIDSFWASVHRDRARESLSQLDHYAFKAEMALEAAAHYARDLDPENFLYELNWAFEFIAVARRYRRDAKRHALMAVRAVELERWASARAELGRVRRGEPRYPAACAAPLL